MCANFQKKRTTLTFLAQIYPNINFRVWNSETDVRIRISILEILCVPIFRQKGELWFFGPKFAKKWILGSEYQKSKSGFGISASKIPCELIFRQNGQIWIFDLNLGKLPNYVRYFGSNIVEGVAESLVEADMSWVEVDGTGRGLKWARWRCMELGGAEWRWMELGGGDVH